MNDNPYAPPASNVSDIEPGGSLERPRIVVFAVRMLWVSFALIFPGTIYDVISPDPELSQTLLIVIGIFSVGVSLAISLWLYSAAWNGKGYARWVLAVLTVLGFAVLAFLHQIEPEVFNVPWVIQAVNVLSYLLVVAGNVLLFAPGANAWYRAMKALR